MGLVLSGTSPDDRLVEIVELPEHRYFVGANSIRSSRVGRWSLTRCSRASWRPPRSGETRSPRLPAAKPRRPSRPAASIEAPRAKRAGDFRRALLAASCYSQLVGHAAGSQRAARQLAELKRDIQSAQQAGKLDHDAVVKLARAVAARELTSAEGSSGADRVRSLRSCAQPLRSAIERRARAEDEVAAELTLILLEMQVAEPAPLLNRYARSPGGAWRAVAARAALRPRRHRSAPSILRRSRRAGAARRLRLRFAGARLG